MFRYAKAGVRIVAFVIDFTFILLLQLLVVAILMSQYRLIADFWLAFGAFMSILPITALYYTCLESSPWQATFGKKLFRLKVVDSKGERLEPRRAFLRFFGKCLGAVLLWVGFIMILWSPKKQGLHDKLAGTYVIH